VTRSGSGGGGGDVRTTRIRLRVAPGSRRTELVGRHGDGWKVRVAAAPEQGRANAAVCDLIASVVDVSRSDVRVVVGVSSRDKLIEVRGVEFDTLMGLLDAACGK
jgi:uncharacterized protein YggU (UPF0235/DUF167 family)